MDDGREEKTGEAGAQTADAPAAPGPAGAQPATPVSEAAAPAPGPDAPKPPAEPAPAPPPPPPPAYVDRIRAMTYYEILDIPRDASFETITQAYKNAIQMFSPQSVAIYSILSSDEAAVMASQVETACRVLRDPIERRKYDKDLDRAAGLVPEPGPKQPAGAEVRTAADEAPLPEQKSFAFAASAFIIEAIETPERRPDSKPPRPAEARAQPDVSAAVTPPPIEPTAEPKTAVATAEPPRATADVPPIPPEEAVEALEPEAAAERPPPLPSRRPEHDEPAHTPRPMPDTDNVPTLLPAPADEAPAPASPAVAARASDEARAPGEPEAPPAAQQAVEETRPGPATICTGALLRRLRERAGLDLRDIAAITRITNTNLKNIEDESYKELPAVVYVRGYIVQYARCLKLPDPAGVAASYIERWRNAVGEIE